MSGPYCKACAHFKRAILGDPAFGECTDIAKIIFDRNGNRMNHEPEVHEFYECSEWTQSPAPDQGKRDE